MPCNTMKCTATNNIGTAPHNITTGECLQDASVHKPAWQQQTSCCSLNAVVQIDTPKNGQYMQHAMSDTAALPPSSFDMIKLYNQPHVCRCGHNKCMPAASTLGCLHVSRNTAQQLGSCCHMNTKEETALTIPYQYTSHAGRRLQAATKWSVCTKQAGLPSWD